MTSTHLTISDISVIIPTINEEGQITRLAADLNSCVGERIIVDGGSSDRTVATARKSGFLVVHSSTGRGTQLNCGAQKSSGRILLFLHADTRLPKTFHTDILKTVNDQPNIIGAFRLAINDARFRFRIVAFFTNLRSHYLKMPYGDQCYFMTRETFDSLGGFPEIPVMEDYVFIRKARKHREIHTLKSQVTTSSRRWRRLGVIRTTIINQLMILGHALGISAEKLANFYRK